MFLAYKEKLTPWIQKKTKQGSKQVQNRNFSQFLSLHTRIDFALNMLMTGNGLEENIRLSWMKSMQGYWIYSIMAAFAWDWATVRRSRYGMTVHLSISGTSQLLLTRFWPNFRGRLASLSQVQRKIEARSRQGQGNVKVRSRQGQGKVKAGSRQG